MKLKTSKGKTGILKLALIALIGYVAITQLPSLMSSVPVQSGSGNEGHSIAAALSVSAMDPLAGTLSNVNAELWSGTLGALTGKVVGETQSNAALQSLSTNLPSDFTGYVMIGNDNKVSGTDRGTEFLYTKSPLTWSNKQALLSFPAGAADSIPVFTEGTLTNTFFDSGTSQATPNITVGSGATVNTEEIRFTVSASGAFGNPQLDNPIALCANQSSNAAVLDYFRPQSYVSTIPQPKWLAGTQVLGGVCYVLPVSSLIDNANILSGPSSQYRSNPNAFRFFLTVKALSGQNPAVSDNSWLVPVDKTYYKDDAGNWQIGWGKDSFVGASTDIGSDDWANAQKINFV